MSFHVFTIAANSFLLNILRFFHGITTLNHNAFNRAGRFARAANAEQEKAFVGKYKTALETNDSATLQSVPYTTGADR